MFDIESEAAIADIAPVIGHSGIGSALERTGHRGDAFVLAAMNDIGASVDRERFGTAGHCWFLSRAGNSVHFPGRSSCSGPIGK